jgi:hypothetical protein
LAGFVAGVAASLLVVAVGAAAECGSAPASPTGAVEGRRGFFCAGLGVDGSASLPAVHGWEAAALADVPAAHAIADEIKHWYNSLVQRLT